MRIGAAAMYVVGMLLALSGTDPVTQAAPSQKLDGQAHMGVVIHDIDHRGAVIQSGSCRRGRFRVPTHGAPSRVLVLTGSVTSNS